MCVQEKKLYIISCTLSGNQLELTVLSNKAVFWFFNEMATVTCSPVQLILKKKNIIACFRDSAHQLCATYPLRVMLYINSCFLASV